MNPKRSFKPISVLLSIVLLVTVLPMGGNMSYAMEPTAVEAPDGEAA